MPTIQAFKEGNNVLLAEDKYDGLVTCPGCGSTIPVGATCCGYTISYKKEPPIPEKEEE